MDKQLVDDLVAVFLDEDVLDVMGAVQGAGTDGEEDGDEVVEAATVLAARCLVLGYMTARAGGPPDPRTQDELDEVWDLTRRVVDGVKAAYQGD